MQLRGIEATADRRNLGYIGRAVNPKHLVGILLVPKGWTFAIAAANDDQAVRDAVLAELKRLMKTDDYDERAHLIGKFTAFEDTSKAQNMEELGYGSSVPTNDGVYIHKYSYVNGGLDFHVAVRSFHDKQDQFDAIGIDNEGTIHGAVTYDAVTGKVSGISGKRLDLINVMAMKMGNYNAIAKYEVAMTYADSTEWNENNFSIAFGSRGRIFETLAALRVTDVDIINISTSATRTATFVVKTKAGNVNLGDTYGDLLADDGAWSFVKKGTASAITISSITYSPFTKQYTFVFASGGGYTTGSAAVGNLTAISVLDGLDIGALESDGVTFTMPA